VVSVTPQIRSGHRGVVGRVEFCDVMPCGLVVITDVSEELIYFVSTSDLKVEAIRPSETSIITTRHHKSGKYDAHFHRCENL
jgi:hypothetical protein